MITNALSVDVEEYYHAEIFQEGTKGIANRYLKSRVEESVDRVLALLGHRDIRATFFILGEVAAAHPTVVRKIAVSNNVMRWLGMSPDLRVLAHRPWPDSRDRAGMIRGESRAASNELGSRAEQRLRGSLTARPC